ncbi:hypothetical protein LT493_33215 [Streptomyces tricolor]|nr:hypothetical protein [Streptomyces tricolor]
MPAALTGAEAELAAARRGTGRTSLTTGELHARLAHADGVLAAVREELTAGPYDPLDALRRIVRAAERLDGARSGVLGTAALLVARSSVAGAGGVPRRAPGAVGTEPRARLAEAVRELGAGGLARADAVAREARELAEREVRAHGTPFVGTEGRGRTRRCRPRRHPARRGPGRRPPAAFGGPETRSRHHL